ncbi:TPA: ParA family protein [Elizabethkingia anophelis]
MIITFATQKGGTGKTTLAIAFANYLSLYRDMEDRLLKVFDYDFQKSFYYKWKEDQDSDLEMLYKVEIIDDTNKSSISDFNSLIELKESKDIYLFDLAGTLDSKYNELLIYSDYIIVPYEYSNVSTKSTIIFISFLGIIESQANRVFIRSKYDKGYNYLNQIEMDNEISKFGKLLESPVFKRNILQTIDTRKLTYEQKYAVQKPFNELIEYINETSKIKI